MNDYRKDEVSEEYISTSDDKYTVILRSDGTSSALRYNEPWPAFPAGVDNLHAALARELASTRQQLATTRFLTIIESPYAGRVQANLSYLRHCIRDSINRGETPFASHLFFTEVLNDGVPEERAKGMELGAKFYPYAARVAVYTDRGTSPGMEAGMALAASLAIPIIHRSIFPPDPIFHHPV